jgi:hypothetical protein
MGRDHVNKGVQWWLKTMLSCSRSFDGHHNIVRIYSYIDANVVYGKDTRDAIYFNWQLGK